MEAQFDSKSFLAPTQNFSSKCENQKVRKYQRDFSILTNDTKLTQRSFIMSQQTIYRAQDSRRSEQNLLDQSPGNVQHNY